MDYYGGGSGVFYSLYNGMELPEITETIKTMILNSINICEYIDENSIIFVEREEKED